MVLEMDVDVVVPGHGPVCDRGALSLAQPVGERE